MMHERRYFAVVLHKGGKLSIIAFYSIKERKEFCRVKDNHARPITWKQWMSLPKDMKC